MTFDRAKKKCTKKNWLTEKFGERIRFDEPMKRHTSLRVGGPADVYIEVQSTEETADALCFCRDNDLPYLAMGEGTNLLVKDGGIRGVVMALKNGNNPVYNKQLNSEEYRVGFFAGMRLPRLCSYALKNGLAGMNSMAGIPGSVGGGISMNCGTRHGSMKDVLTSVTALFSDGRVKTYPAENICFRYRNLDWKTTLENRDPELSQEKPIVLEGEFHLVSSDKDRLRKEMKNLLKNRISKQPRNLASAGCFFKNLPDGVSAGKLIDQAGLKGLSNGDAQVSAKHANFIVNKGNATASNILQLAETINARVYKEFGVELIPEVQIVGI